jgi:hypothetical protein
VLVKQLPRNAVVGVVGASHSAVLAMKNVYEARDDVRIVNLYRGELLFAEYMDGWILYDNTGLKGVAADWARDVLQRKDDPRIKRVKLVQDSKTEKEIYNEELSRCTHLAAAVGFDRNPTPAIEVGGRRVDTDMVFDGLSGRFKGVPSVYGIGIAYPEIVTDPKGNVESAVGWMKFMRFGRRVAADWAAEN